VRVCVCFCACVFDTWHENPYVCMHVHVLLAGDDIYKVAKTHKMP